MLRASRGARPQELLGTNIAANLQLVVQVAKEYTEQLGAGKIIEMLEAHKSYHGLYYYLGGYIAFSEDPEARPHSPAAYGPGPCWRAGVGLRRRIGGGARLRGLPQTFLTPSTQPYSAPTHVRGLKAACRRPRTRVGTLQGRVDGVRKVWGCEQRPCRRPPWLALHAWMSSNVVILRVVSAPRDGHPCTATGPARASSCAHAQQVGSMFERARPRRAGALQVHRGGRAHGAAEGGGARDAREQPLPARAHEAVPHGGQAARRAARPAPRPRPAPRTGRPPGGCATRAPARRAARALRQGADCGDPAMWR